MERSTASACSDAAVDQSTAAAVNGSRTQLPLRTEFRTLEEMERAYIEEVLAHCGGKISGKGGAAEILGMKRTTLISRMEKLGIRKMPAGSALE